MIVTIQPNAFVTARRVVNGVKNLLLKAYEPQNSRTLATDPSLCKASVHGPQGRTG